MAKKNLDKITSLDFVNKIDLVGMFKKSARPVINDNIIQPGINLNKQNVHTYDYGQSFNQVNLSKIPDVHDLGFTGKGITICVMDAGVSNLSHEVFADMITNGRLKAQYDFVNHDSVVANQADSGEGSHGTYTLALIGGFKQGQLIGPAFEANYLLAKTENTQSESPVEEDNWIAAMEWADSIGVDVTSTSLGYRDGFDFGYTDYTAQDMNGNTTRITIAADLAVKKGVVVVNSAGNEAGILEPSTTATDGAHNTLIAPADGDSVITVGAVTSTGTKASFSSYGPTADNRTKPDLMAVGVSDYIPNATSGNVNGYSSGNGTSFSCPIVAGVAALILEKHPTWTPMQVRDALRKTASRKDNPDNNYGWGVVDALAAINYNPDDTSSNNFIPENFELAQNYPNPFNPSTKIKYGLKEDGYVTLKVYNMLGSLVSTLVSEYQAAKSYEVEFNAKTSPNPLASGVYFYTLHVGTFTVTKKMVILK